MIRARFYIKKSDCGNDYRPVKWPIGKIIDSGFVFNPVRINIL